MISRTLDLGCGLRPKNPFQMDQVYGVDISENTPLNIRGADLAVEPIPFENNYNGTKMKVRLYHWYEVPFIVSVSYAYFDIVNFIPSHWLYAFYEETNIAYIVYNLSRSNIQLSSVIRAKLEALSHNRSELHALEEVIYQKCSILINKNMIFKHYSSINAKYGITIELLILNYLSEQ